MHSAGAICNGRDAVAHGTLGGSAAGPTNGGASGAAESWAPPAGLNFLTTDIGADALTLDQIVKLVLAVIQKVAGRHKPQVPKSACRIVSAELGRPNAD